MTNMFKTMIQDELAKKTKLKQCKQVANLEAQNKLMKQQLAQMKIELEKQESKKKDGLFKSFNKEVSAAQLSSQNSPKQVQIIKQN